MRTKVRSTSTRTASCADNLARHGVRLDKQPKFIKINDNTEGEELAKRSVGFLRRQLVTFVFNFLDILAHGRSNNVILKEIAGTEAAFRTLMKTWFIALAAVHDAEGVRRSADSPWW